MYKKILPVSIIIPSYNSSRFIEECLRSINSGLYIPAQIIVIDDCSTDDSFSIVNKLIQSHTNLEVHKTQFNGGAALARLVGFHKATEEFVGTVDADDFLETDAVYDAYKQIKTSNGDLCIWKLWRINSVGKMWLDPANPSTFPLHGREAFLMTLGGWRIHYLGITKKSLFLNAYKELEDSGFKITEAYNSDELISRILLRSVNKIVSSKLRYYYRVNDESTSLKVSKNHLFRLRTEMWIIDYSSSAEGAPKQALFRSLIKCAFFIFQNKQFFGAEETKSELIKFLNFANQQKDFYQFLYLNKEFFRAFFIIYCEYTN